MFFLVLLMLVFCVGMVIFMIADTVPDEVWHALAERIRNPPPHPSLKMMEELHRHWEAEDLLNSWPQDPTKDTDRRGGELLQESAYLSMTGDRAGE
jgi:hypothetical protein